jgi:CHAT domain-containing protein
MKRFGIVGIISLLLWMGLLRCTETPQLAPPPKPEPTVSLNPDTVKAWVDRLIKQAKTHREHANLDSAILKLREGLSLAKEHLPPTDPTITNLLYRLGFYQKEASNIPSSLNSYREGLGYVHLRVPWNHNDSAEAGKFLNSMAVSFQRLLENDSALAYHLPALKIRKEVFKDTSWEYSVSLQNLGMLYAKQKEFELAERLERGGFVIASHQKDAFRYLTGFVNLGDVLLMKGDTTAAESHFLEATTKKSGFEGYYLPGLAALYKGLAHCQSPHSKFDQGMAYFAQALAKLEVAYPQQPHRDKAITLECMGRYCLPARQPLLSLGYFHAAIRQFAPAYADTNIRHNPPTYLLGHEPGLFEALCGKAHAWEMLPDSGHIDSAFGCYRLAFQFADKLRRNFGSVDEKAELSTWIYPEYERAIRLAIAQYQASHAPKWLSLAFEWMERSKANELFDVLSQVELSQEYALPDSVWTEGRHLTDSIDATEAAIAAGDLNAAQRLVTFQTRWDELQAWVKLNYPGYFFQEADYLPWQTARQQVAGRDTMLLEYFFGDSTLYALAAIGNRDTAFSVAWGDGLDLSLRDFLRSLDLNEQADLGECYHAQAHSLFQALMAPALGMASGKLPQRLVVVPDGRLSFIPFEALLTAPAGADANPKKLPYLLRSTTVSYIQSMQVLLRTPKRYENHYGALGIGSGLEMEKDAARLQFAPEEAQNAVDNLGGETALDGAATEERFKRSAPRYATVHVATHGQLDAEAPLRSRLLFHTDAQGHEDGKLHAYELYDMHLGARLTVLSACSVAKGKSLKGQGVMSLGRAFLVAGCPNVVMTLADVNDRSAKQIMHHFYALLAKGKPAAEALRQARLVYLDEAGREFAHPSYWAPFILTGQGDVQVWPTPSLGGIFVWIVILGTVLSLMVVGWMVWRVWGRGEIPNEQS